MFKNKFNPLKHKILDNGLVNLEHLFSLNFIIDKMII